MPRNSVGVYTLPSAQFATQTTISSSAVNLDFSDIATALTQSIATTGVTTVTAAFVGAAGTVAAPSYTVAGNTTTGWYVVSAGVWGFSAVGTNIFQISSSGITMTAGAGGGFIDRNGGSIFAMPIGTIIDYSVAVAPWTAPKGWLYCYGQAVSRTTYAGLFSIISTTYGAGDGAGTFNVPDLRGRIIAGLDNMGGVGAGRLTNAATNGIDGTALANVGGVQSLTILQANMPSGNANISGLGITLTNAANLLLVANNISTNSGSPTDSMSVFANVGTSATIAFSGSITSNGSGTAANVCQPTIIVAKMIYSGV